MEWAELGPSRCLGPARVMARRGRESVVQFAKLAKSSPAADKKANSVKPLRQACSWAATICMGRWADGPMGRWPAVGSLMIPRGRNVRRAKQEKP